jgi:hypothetical protein
MDTMHRFAISGVVSTILTLLSWILVLLIALFYFRVLMKGAESAGLRWVVAAREGVAPSQNTAWKGRCHISTAEELVEK